MVVRLTEEQAGFLLGAVCDRGARLQRECSTLAAVAERERERQLQVIDGLEAVLESYRRQPGMNGASHAQCCASPQDVPINGQAKREHEHLRVVPAGL